MSVEKHAKERRDGELRHKEEAEALEEANLDSADEVYDEPDRFTYSLDDNDEISDTQPVVESDEYDIDNADFERTLV